MAKYHSFFQSTHPLTSSASLYPFALRKAREKMLEMQKMVRKLRHDDLLFENFKEFLVQTLKKLQFVSFEDLQDLEHFEEYHMHH